MNICARLNKRHDAINALRSEFWREFPNESEDPALIREYMAKIDRDLRYEAEDKE